MFSKQAMSNALSDLWTGMLTGNFHIYQQTLMELFFITRQKRLLSSTRLALKKVQLQTLQMLSLLD